MKKLFFCKLFSGLFFFLAVTATGFAQTEITGKVTDFMTFEPVDNASVYIKNTTVGTITNVDGRFALRIPKAKTGDTLVVSSIGFISYEIPVSDFKNGTDIYLEEDIASLEEVLLVAETRPQTGNEIMQRAVEKLPENLPDSSFIQKGFLRHKERNRNEYKWLVEAAVTLLDSEYSSDAGENPKIKVDEIRKSYDLRDIDSLFALSAYLKNKGEETGQLSRRSVKTSALVEAIRWNDQRINGLDNLFNGKLNAVRNANHKTALFGEKMLENHQFTLDTILVDDGRKIYKLKISKGEDFVGLNTPNIYNEGFEPSGTIYIYYDNFAVKRLEYELKAGSDIQKRRSRSLFDTQILHKLVLNYREFQDKMYLSYVYYETPKLINTGDRSSDRAVTEAAPGFDKGAQYYYTIQELLFSDIIRDPLIIAEETGSGDWSADIFSPKAYNPDFWKNYNVLLEGEEEEKLIRDLTRRATLFKE